MNGTVRPPLVGRESELARLTAVLVHDPGARASAILFGEPGVGKSALLDAVGGLAEERGMTVLRSAGAEFEAAIAFAALNQLLLPVRAAFDELEPDLRTALRVALGLESGEPPARMMVATAVISVLSLIGRNVPVVILVDDAQWLDDASADIFAATARRTQGTNIRVFSALRPGGQPRAEGHFERVDVSPLPDAGARSLLHRRHPAMLLRARDRIVFESRGNPLALIELGDASRTGLFDTDASLQSVLPLPDRLRSVFAARIGSLPRPAQDVLLLVALDDSGDLAPIRAAAGRDVAADVAAADVAGILSGDTGAYVTFRHPLIRSAVVQRANSGQRRVAHQALAGAWANHPGRYAWHRAEAALGADDEVAALLAAEAQRARQRGDPFAAAAAMRRSADLTSSSAGRAGRLSLTAYFTAEVLGDLSAVSRLLSQARALSPGAGSLSAAAAAASVIMYSDSDVPRAYRILTEALDDVLASGARPSDEEITATAWALSFVCRLSGRQEMWHPLRQIVDRWGDRLPPFVHLSLAVTADPAHVSDEALARLDSELAALGGEHDPAQVIRVSFLAAEVDRLSRCTQPLLHLRRDGDASGAFASVVNALLLLATDALASGDWNAALGHADEGLQISIDHEYLNSIWYFRYVTGLIAAARGDGAGAEAHLDWMIGWAEQREALIVPEHAFHVRMLAALSRGDVDEAWNQALRISPDGIESGRALQLFIAFDQIEAAERSGHHDEAVRFVRALETAGTGRISSRWAMLVAAGRALTEPGVIATKSFECALAAAPADLWPFDRARVELAFGEHLRRERGTAVARRHLGAALETFDRLGAAPWSERAKIEFDATGVTRGPGAQAVAVLTPQEARIAHYAASGLSNKAIGEQMHLSTRTVSGHLYRVFPKLGITSRAGLRDALEEWERHTKD